MQFGYEFEVKKPKKEPFKLNKRLDWNAEPSVQNRHRQKVPEGQTIDWTGDCVFKPKINHTVPDFKKLQSEFQDQLERSRVTRQATIGKAIELPERFRKTPKLHYLDDENMILKRQKDARDKRPQSGYNTRDKSFNGYDTSKTVFIKDSCNDIKPSMTKAVHLLYNRNRQKIEEKRKKELDKENYARKKKEKDEELSRNLKAKIWIENEKKKQEKEVRF